MQEILEEIKELQSKERGCVFDLRAASPVGHDVEGRSYAAQTVDNTKIYDL